MKQRIIYRTIDGEQFDSLPEAKDHERGLIHSLIITTLEGYERQHPECETEGIDMEDLAVYLSWHLRRQLHDAPNHTDHAAMNPDSFAAHLHGVPLQARLVIITGPAGAGKTTLAQRILREVWMLTEDDPPVLSTARSKEDLQRCLQRRLLDEPNYILLDDVHSLTPAAQEILELCQGFGVLRARPLNETEEKAIRVPRIIITGPAALYDHLRPTLVQAHHISLPAPH